ncbi:hypothetical protein WG906_12770 [Pedobacter sp. P351]|uniref:hypothetical protein n=1 Tax=Pedobacter superstes TaxID=3133441 RepID=UPI0030A6D2A8
MQVHLIKQNSILTPSTQRNLSSTSILIGIAIIIATITAIVLIPGYSTFFTGALLIGATIRYLAKSINRKPLLIEITDNKLIYLSEERNELITINSEDILSINHKFCELQIHTRNEQIHNINLLNTGSEQTRWEIKEHIKGLTAGIR